MNKLKNVLIDVGFMLAVLLASGYVGYLETHYSRDCTVYSIDGNIVSVIDKGGMLWNFEGDGFTVGQRVIVRFDNNFTDNNVYDDIIIDVKGLD